MGAAHNLGCGSSSDAARPQKYCSPIPAGKRRGWAGALITCALLLSAAPPQPAPITIDYPENGSVFPPGISAPTFLWRDLVPDVTEWRIDVTFAKRSAAIHVKSAGDLLRVGEIDPRCVSKTNELPTLTSEQATARTWVPDAPAWTAIQTNSVERAATIIITGFRAGAPVSAGRVVIRTSKDPVGAPIFYRDVPLMPSETQKGIIKPLAPDAVPLIAWRLRNVGESRSRLLMEGLHTCANCHSFSRDGKTLGMDLDGPRNDKGLYTVLPVAPRMSIHNEDVVAWSSFRGKMGGKVRVGFMSQVSPDGRYVVTMINGAEFGGGSRRKDVEDNYYVANFKDYHFLQVFYPTRGILAWYSRETGRLRPLPGADDLRYVHTNAVWSPDGKYLVFARAQAREPYPEGRPAAQYANDSNETPIQYDLYRITFDEGKGCIAEPIAGASGNGMSNSFPKISPDGKWIVFVCAKNGLLMRPDGQLYIVPAKGGRARRMRCNTPLMNSWHSFSPNGRWLVFSSKSRSPYTQMYLTHVDDNGRDTPPILIENATAANRAVNIPEFVNIPPEGLLGIDVPAVEYYKQFDLAWALAEKGEYAAAIPAWEEAVRLNPDDAKALMNLGAALLRAGRPDEAIPRYRKALEIDPEYPEAEMNLGVALAGKGNSKEAVEHYEKALALAPGNPEVHNDLGVALARMGKPEQAIAHLRSALEANPDYPEVHNNLGAALAQAGKLDEAITEFERALLTNPNSTEVHNNLGRALTQTRRFSEAIAHFERALEINPGSAEIHNSLGVALAWDRRVEDAAAHFKKALELDPGFTEAHSNLGDISYYMMGNPSEALVHWREVLRAQPNHPVVLNQTARLLATCPDNSIRNGAEAVALGERAAQLSGGREPAVLDTLAAAYAENGRFSEAIETAQRALAIAAEQNKQALAQTLKSRIALYRTRTPLRRAQQSSGPPP